MKRLALIDAASVLYRCFFALPPMSSAVGEPTQALFGFAKFLLKFLKEFTGGYALIAFDGRNGKQRRTALWPAYKAHRQKAPDDLVVQMDRCPELCEALGVPYLVFEDEEADDVIASACHWARRADAEVQIYSQDKDLLQLIGPSVEVVAVHRDLQALDAQAVRESYGIHPGQLGDWLALVGDSSDNIPGVSGIGPKKATHLLQQFGNLAGILDSAEQIPGKLGQSLQDGKEQALISRQLVELIADVPALWDWEFLKLRAPDQERCHTLFKGWNFQSLLRQLPSAAPDCKPRETLKNRAEEPDLFDLAPEKALERNIARVAGKEEFTQFLADLERAHRQILVCALDGGAKIVPGGLSSVTFIGIETGDKAWLLDVKSLKIKSIDLDKILNHLAKFGPWYTDSAKDWYHLRLQSSSGGDVETLLRAKDFFDVSLVGHLLQSREAAQALVSRKASKEIDETALTRSLTERLAVLMTWAKHLPDQLDQERLRDLFERIEQPLVPILARMEHTGIRVSKERLLVERSHLIDQLGELERRVLAAAGEDFNLNSPKQLAKILYERLGLRPPKKIATGYSTDATVLESLSDQHEIIPLILDYRMLEKLRSTYIEALPNCICEATGRIHPRFMQTVTATGRLSCQEPNLQNIPIKSRWGEIIRSAFVAPDNWRLVAIDYSQIELRLMAHFSQDEALIAAFCQGDDVHSLTAAQIFQVPLKEVSRAQRAQAKAVNFGIIYGQQAFGLAAALKISRARADAFIRAYFARYTGVATYIEKCKAALESSQTVTTLFGRKRSLVDLPKGGRDKRLALRLAINSPIQGTGADLLKVAMIRIQEQIVGKSARMLLQIHDELLFECPQDEVQELVEICVPAMENAAHLRVPLTVNVSVGNNWAEC